MKRFVVDFGVLPEKVDVERLYVAIQELGGVCVGRHVRHIETFKFSFAHMDTAMVASAAVRAILDEAGARCFLREYTENEDA